MYKITNLLINREAGETEYTCFLVASNKIVGHCFADEEGDGIRILYIEDDAEQKFCQYLESLPPFENPYAENDLVTWTPEFFVGEQIADVEERRWLRRACRTKTVFRLSKDRRRHFRTLDSVYNPNLKEYLLRTFGDGVQIMNEQKGCRHDTKVAQST